MKVIKEYEADCAKCGKKIWVHVCNANNGKKYSQFYEKDYFNETIDSIRETVTSFSLTEHPKNCEAIS